DPVLVPLAGEHTRYEDLPDPAVAQRPHRPAVVRSPAGEVTHHPHATGVRRPDREPDAAVLDPGTEDLPQPLVAPFVDQVQVQLTEGGRVPVRIVEPLAAHLDPVVEHPTGHGRLEDALVVDAFRRVPLLTHQDGRRAGAAAQGTDDGALAVRVRA